jgi:two-component system sensor histidine kinase/response regulator
MVNRNGVMTNAAKILVVDDDESIRDSCTQVLIKNQYTVETAEDGRIGLAKMKTFCPDLLLLDLKMPGLSGMDVLKEIHDRDPYLIIVVITGYASIESAVDTMKQGVYDYLPKPFTPDQLRIIVKRGLERRSFRVEADRLRKEKETMRKNFVSMVSHELRSPLAAVQQNLMVVTGGMAGEIPSKVKDILLRMRERITSLIGLISDWLDLSRIDSGEFITEMAPVNLRELLIETIESLNPLADTKKVSLRLKAPKDFPTILGNRETLKMLFSNLIHNAIKYNKKNGFVETTLKTNDHRIQVAVKDSGIGIPDDKLPLIFTEFYRVKEVKPVEGSGLGLAIAKKIAEAHLGTIEVESVAGKGTTFTVTLP